MLLGEGEGHLGISAKMPMAFFSTSRSMRVQSGSVQSGPPLPPQRGLDPELGHDLHLRPAAALHQGNGFAQIRSINSGMY